ncbi:MAG: heme-binding protein [Flavobacteriales bacterium]
MSAPASPLPLPYGPPITLALAREVAAAAEQEALRHQWPMAIAIMDSTGHLAHFIRIDGTQLASMDIAIAKAASAVNYRRPTKVFEDMLAAGGAGLRALSLPGAMAVAGGNLLVKDGHVIGAIGVSGMAAADDAVVAQAGADALT